MFDISVKSSKVMEGDSFWVRSYIYNNSNDTVTSGSLATLSFSPGNDLNTADDVEVGTATVYELKPYYSSLTVWNFDFPALGLARPIASAWAVITVDGTSYKYGTALTVTKRIEPTIVVSPLQLVLRRPPDGKPPVGLGQMVSPAIAARIEQSATAEAEVAPDRILADSVIVRFRDAEASQMLARRVRAGKARAAEDAPDEAAAAGLAALPRDCVALRPFHAADALARSVAARTLSAGTEIRGFTEAQTGKVAAAILRASVDRGPAGMFHVRIGNGVDPWKICRELMRRSDVVYANPSRVFRPAAAPNDPYYPYQWNLDRIGMSKAWDLTGNTPGGVRVCIVDTGVRVTHTDLDGRTTGSLDVAPGNGDAYGNNDPDDDDLDGHGTATAGVIAAIRNNRVLVAGLSPALVIPVNASDPTTGGIVNYEEGIYWGVQEGAGVINLGFESTGTPLASEIDAVEYASAQDVVICAPAGNGDADANKISPASIPGCLSVGAVSDRSADAASGRTNDRVRKSDGWAWGSNYGSTVDLCAPGQGKVGADNYSLFSLGIAGNAAYVTDFSGTSAACAHVAGVSALIRQVNPALSALQVRHILQSTAEDLVGRASEDVAGWDKYHGYGLVNAYKAVWSARDNGYFTIRNTGTLPLNVARIRLVDTNQTPAKVLDPAPAWISWAPATAFTIPGLGFQVVGVSVDFRQITAGRSGLRLLIESNDAANSPADGGVYLRLLTSSTGAVLPWNAMP